MNYCEEQALCGSYCVRWDQCFWCQRYQSGQAKPNYPMPAIRCEAIIDKHRVEIVQWDEYGYCDTVWWQYSE